LKSWICLFGVEAAQAYLHTLRRTKQHGSELGLYIEGKEVEGSMSVIDLLLLLYCHK
jgi:hypothetical protein